MKKMIIVILFLASALLLGCEKNIGGDRDENGCLVAAGYSWEEDIGACTRAWELDENQAKAAKIAVLPYSFPVTITQVETLRCPGCFIVHLQRNDNRELLKVTLANWEIAGEAKSEVSSFEECVAAGNPVMESYPQKCMHSGKTFTEEIRHVCTDEEKSATACTLEYMPVCGEYLLNTGETFYETFGNKCAACAEMKVIAYTLGGCPE